MKPTLYKFEYIEGHTIRLEASHRGGGIEIDAAEFLGIEGARMTAYQNYLGGGMLGSVQNSYNLVIHGAIEGKRTTRGKVEKLAEALKRYFYNITNEEAGDYDEYAASSDYETHQATRRASAY
jgi:hypothetical protein